ncbi:hypothetical protein N2152v2_000792 [Parachlorella kessleri]
MRNARVRLVSTKLVRSPCSGTDDTYALSPCDQLSLTTATARASFWKQRFDTTALEKCLELVLEDLPFLAGRVLRGKEPLMKVRVARLADGDVLGITLSHYGMRWPRFLAHFAARYRQAATGIEPAPELLLRSVDRSGLSSAGLATELHEEPFGLSKALPAVKASLGDYCRAASVLLRDSSKKKDLVILHVPQTRVKQLKADVFGATKDAAITTGDVVQALAGMLVNAASGKPLLPEPPKYQVVLVQLQGVHPAYFGNSVHLLPVQLPLGREAPTGDAYLSSLAELAALIRTATKAFRAHPEASVGALAQLEQLVQTPIHRMLGWLAGHRLPYATCTTNYIGHLPADKDLDFGFGEGPVAMRWLVTPFGSDMAVIRPAMPPFSEGLFCHIPLSAHKARRLQRHPLLQALAPDARFLGSQA